MATEDKASDTFVSPSYAIILDAAADLFNSQGYRATSMRQISDEVGLKAGSLYSHISSKEDILYTLVIKVAELYVKSGDEAAAATGSASRRMQTFIRGHLQIVASHRRLSNLTLIEWRNLSSARRAHHKALRDKYEASLMRIVRDGMAVGEFDSSSPEHLVKLWVLPALNWAGQWYQPEGQLRPVELADQFASLVLRALGAAPREDS